MQRDTGYWCQLPLRDADAADAPAATRAAILQHAPRLLADPPLARLFCRCVETQLRREPAAGRQPRHLLHAVAHVALLLSPLLLVRLGVSLLRTVHVLAPRGPVKLQ